MAETEDQLAALRREIDAVDTKLHDLLMQRTELAVRVGEVKATAQPIGRSPRDGPPRRAPPGRRPASHDSGSAAGARPRRRSRWVRRG